MVGKNEPNNYGIVLAGAKSKWQVLPTRSQVERHKSLTGRNGGNSRIQLATRFPPWLISNSAMSALTAQADFFLFSKSSCAFSGEHDFQKFGRRP